MKILVINGTMVRGCTYHLKESFLEPLRAGNEITEFYLPGDAPGFCTGCKVCFMDSEEKCPHAAKVRLMFAICRLLQKGVLKKGINSADNRYWIEQGWIRGD